MLKRNETTSSESTSFTIQNYFKIQGIFASLYLINPPNNSKLIQLTFKKL
jgi:hypothetical protein